MFSPMSRIRAAGGLALDSNGWVDYDMLKAAADGPSTKGLEAGE
jgi:hypothetical protein